ncbi:hypothetical protein ACH0CG_02670 [Microbacterium sp. 179-I 1D1 NHS]|uniref:hypothetical protein n=1 Tax=Microbacterium sp. 179-I 1D1 NHS TaxID=3374298 RepID=UPI003879CB43
MTTSDTSSTPQPTAGETTSAVISLGKKIVESLRADDLLSQWMAHHVAERMVALDRASVESRRQASDEVADLILRIWEHGRQVAFDADPTQLSASVVRAVAKLDPEPGERYFRAFGFVPTPEGTGTEIDKYLRVALGLDDQAGRLIHALVAYAAEIAADKETDWIQTLRNVNVDPLLTIRGLRDFSSESMQSDDPDYLKARHDDIARRAAALRKLLKPLARDAPKTPTSASLRRRLQREGLI